MNSQVLIAGIYAGAFLVLFGIGELLYHVFNVKAEISRKVVHIVTGLICMSFPLFVTTHWVVLFLTCSFAIILSASIRFNFLKSINAVDRKTSGSYLFPVSIYLLYWAYAWFGCGNSSANNVLWQSSFDLKGILSNSSGIYYLLPLLIFSIADPVAALVGKTWPLGKYSLALETKTLAGSSAFFIVAFLISFAFFQSQYTATPTALGLSALIALATAVAEGLSQKGYDNLFIPAAAITVLYFIS